MKQSFSYLLLKSSFVLAAQVVSDRVSDRSKGFGFVTFASQDEAHKAVEEMNGKVVSCFVHMILWILEKEITDDIGRH